MNRCWGLVIAGGRGKRLGGVRKATLRLGKVRLIDRVAAALEPRTKPLLVGTGPEPVTYPLPRDAVAVADLPDGPGGPLAAVRAAAGWLKREGITSGLLATAAVDVPLLPFDYLARMTAALGDGDAIEACWGEAFYPTHAVWRVEALQHLLAQNEAGSLRRLLEAAGARRLDWSSAYTEDPFAGLNTLDDLVRLGRRASVASYSQSGD